MSIRFRIPKTFEERKKQEDWCKKYVLEGEYNFNPYSLDPHVDFVNEEDAILYSLTFGSKRTLSRLDRMIAREIALEEMEKTNARNSTSGMGAWPLKESE